jgi:hypothetical protein
MMRGEELSGLGRQNEEGAKDGVALTWNGYGSPRLLKVGHRSSVDATLRANAQGRHSSPPTLKCRHSHRRLHRAAIRHHGRGQRDTTAGAGSRQSAGTRDFQFFHQQEYLGQEVCSQGCTTTTGCSSRLCAQSPYTSAYTLHRWAPDLPSRTRAIDCPRRRTHHHCTTAHACTYSRAYHSGCWTAAHASDGRSSEYCRHYHTRSALCSSCT